MLTRYARRGNLFSTKAIKPPTRKKQNMKNTTTIEIEANVKAFTGQGRRRHKLSISPEGTVRVWDDVAGHYTTCHSMSAATQSRIRKLAQQEFA